ncbi:aa-his-dipept: Xaa-His dipeptidase [Rubrobacter radiotolerans]|uniref:Aa-his-dipept: Xaa-His dipeptidase n=1 Tax=Rubrobacter radiotolerans TaxID=42256 RepID=A0A023X6V5_RUBRA|nr:beta-Ala-His dipeptidase [Rubrobacter radiotolerans]AHY47750.1 aa-his-dipept: Xaa-His dipeptidase [Rubrobacter radiotolerans]MDX5895226.1 beta-Ala-His dipeptidase [Rubrobacter radiotolerans]SMC07680.1 dipeptidase D [Rubrobacter radiotolerans DSM 5868]
METTRVLEGLEPKEVLYFFEELSKRHRCSRYEKQASDWVASFSEERGLEYHQDDLDSIIVKKPGTPGYEDAPTVILHGHIDMVCKTDEGVEHDFSDGGVDLEVEGEFVKAKGTTLGADNGLGIAYMLALLDSDDIPHPPLECVMTVMEEMGKVGGDNIDVSLLSGKRMIDFNWIEEKQLLAGCSGDVSCKIHLDADWETPEDGLVPMKLDIKGLKGGHCEFDIHLERANSIVLLARILNDVLDEKDIRIAAVSGGVQNNVIPAESEATFLAKSEDVDDISRIVEKTGAEIKNEFAISDPDIDISVARSEAEVSKVFSKDAARTLTRFIALLPDGVQTQNLEVEGNWETSNNIGIMTMDEDGAEIITTITSAVTSRKHDVLKKIFLLAEMSGDGVKAEQMGLDAPEFPWNPDSEMLKIAKKSYRDVMGREPEVLVSVCSLELGMFTQRIPGLDTVGIGTELLDVHSPRERMNHESVARVWPVIKDVMKNLDK